MKEISAGRPHMSCTRAVRDPCGPPGAATVATMGPPDVVELVDLAALRAVAGLFREVWRTGLDEQQVHPDLMRALAHTGNYVAGAYAGGTLAGASVGFRTGDG